MKKNSLVRQSYLVASLLLPAAASAQFSIAVIPDTQMYAELHPEIFEAQVNWIVTNQASENIIYVAHLGDMKDDQTCDDRTVNEGSGGGRTEWQIVNQTLGLLDAANIPFGVVPGNHDFDSLNPGTPAEDCPNWTSVRPLSLYNTFFGPSRFDNPASPGFQPTYGDTDPLSPFFGTPGNRLPGSNEDNFSLVESDGVKFVIINLAYREIANELVTDPADPLFDTCNNSELPWADGLLKDYSDRLGIITSHYFLDENPGDAFGSWGQCVYDFLSNNPNLFMMLGAHERGEAWRVDTNGRAGMQPVHILLSDYQSVRYGFRDGDPATPEDAPNVADIQFDRLFGARSQHGDSGFMRIMRFDTATGMVNIETFTPAIDFSGLNWDTAGTTRHDGHSHVTRTMDLVSDYTPASGAGMDNETASTFDISFLGYVPITPPPADLVSCGVDFTGGDLIMRGFYHPAYPGSSIDTVELFLSARAPGAYEIRLDARLNAYNGALIASDTQSRILSGNDEDNVSYLFDLGGAAVAPGSTVTFTLTQESGQSDEVFYAVDAANFPLGGGGPGSCDVIQTSGTTPPLDTLRRNGLWVRINGAP